MTGVHIEAYRGLHDLQIEGLGDINVLIGPSDSGKSSLLEAIWLATDPDAASDRIGTILRARGAAGKVSVRALFPNLEQAAALGTVLHLGVKEQEGSASERLTLGLTWPLASERSLEEMVRARDWSDKDVAILNVMSKHERLGANDQTSTIHSVATQVALS